MRVKFSFTGLLNSKSCSSLLSFSLVNHSVIRHCHLMLFNCFHAVLSPPPYAVQLFQYAVPSPPLYAVQLLQCCSFTAFLCCSFVSMLFLYRLLMLCCSFVSMLFLYRLRLLFNWFNAFLVDSVD